MEIQNRPTHPGLCFVQAHSLDASAASKTKKEAARGRKWLRARLARHFVAQDEMMQSQHSWEDLRRNARSAERRLEDKIAAYTAISKAQARAAVARQFDEGASCGAGRTSSGGVE